MEKKINIAELLKDCPSGMELDCTMFDNVTFVRVDNSRKQFPVEIAVSGMRSIYLTKEGCFHDTTLSPASKCVIFPKGKTTWEGFVPPCKFKDGDIIVCDNSVCSYISLYKGMRDSQNFNYYACIFSNDGTFATNDWVFCNNPRKATEEEKEKLFQAIKDNGYKWNAETNILEKLIEPKFKVGDRIRLKNSPNNIISTVTKINGDGSLNVNDYSWVIEYKLQDKYELVPNKFDITALKPFESRVLVRCNDSDIWRPAIYGFTNSDSGRNYIVGGYYWKQCIPYEGNQELLGTTNKPKEYGSK